MHPTAALNSALPKVKPKWLVLKAKKLEKVTSKAIKTQDINPPSSLLKMGNFQQGGCPFYFDILPLILPSFNIFKTDPLS